MKPSVCIVVPVYNEEEVLPAFHQRISEVMDTMPAYSWHLLLVNDGSRDASARLIDAMAASDARITVVHLSRNFGKEVAMAAGLDHADADATILIDADLQDPPELMQAFIDEWQSGYDMVYAQRLSRHGDSWFKRSTAAGFYRLIGRMSSVRIPPDTGDYRLLSRRAVLAVRQLREHHRFMKGLFAWIGYPSKAVTFHRDARAAGGSKFNFWRLWNFAIEGITSFSIVPLKLATYFGSLIALAALLRGLWVIFKTLVWSDPVPGYPSLMVTLLFLGGMQLMFIGILGEYIGRIFNETKGRPLYFIDRVTGHSDQGSASTQPPEPGEKALARTGA
ncbi:glycosyltransferase family 2 protein [Ottowia thiooxydans]|uniref:glycosyltransferase family 2 protein n=1 Tax=Ottowia thiooxydans TaxID=219182 RepID=UPI0004269995|nr:glycosyltransferase family 2 protein [Ottowia thiooxydans]